ncbi:MAG: TetR/AcrR family transcriptional regulator [Fidelibacterota bacterium]
MKNKKSKKFKDIVTTGEKLFKQFGMKRVSVEEICQKGNVSKATFYKYFKNKNELIKYIFQSWFDNTYDQMEIIDQQKIPFPLKIKKIFGLKKQMVEEMSPEFIEEYLNLTPELLPFFNQAKQESYKKFSHYIEKWKAEGHIRKDIKPQFIIAAMESLEYFTKRGDLPKLYDEYIDYVEEIFNFFFYGILTERKEDDSKS